MPYYRFHGLWRGGQLPAWVTLSDAPRPDSILDLHQARLAKARRLRAQIAAQQAEMQGD